MSSVFLLFHLTFAGNYDVLLQQVIDRRGDLERQAQVLSQQIATSDQALLSMEAQKNELELTLQRDQLKLSTLSQKKISISKSLEAMRPANQDNQKLVQAWLDMLKTRVQTSLPFETSERLKMVESLQARFQHREPLAVLLWDLWSFTESEIQLTRGVHTTLTTLPGQTEPVEVVRLGMLAMYERSDKAGYALWKKEDSVWKRNSLDSSTDQKAVDHLLQSASQKTFQTVETLPSLELKEL